MSTLRARRDLTIERMRKIPWRATSDGFGKP